MSTIVWVALPFAVLGSIELLARAAVSHRPTVRIAERNIRRR